MYVNIRKEAFNLKLSELKSCMQKEIGKLIIAKNALNLKGSKIVLLIT